MNFTSFNDGFNFRRRERQPISLNVQGILENINEASSYSILHALAELKNSNLKNWLAFIARVEKRYTSKTVNVKLELKDTKAKKLYHKFMLAFEVEMIVKCFDMVKDIQESINENDKVEFILNTMKMKEDSRIAEKVKEFTVEINLEEILYVNRYFENIVNEITKVEVTQEMLNELKRIAESSFYYNMANLTKTIADTIMNTGSPMDVKKRIDTYIDTSYLNPNQQSLEYKPSDDDTQKS